MKIIAPQTYLGIHATRKPNYAAKLIYRAKFLHDTKAEARIIKQILQALANEHFDTVIAVPCTKTKRCFSFRLAKAVANITGKKFIPFYFRQPEKYDFTGKTILLIDDVITTGKTATKNADIIKKLSTPDNIIFTAFAKSSNLLIV